MRQLLVILILLNSAGLWSQAPSKFYCKYGGDGVDIGYGVKEIYNRQYVVIGSTSSYGAGGTDAFMLLIDSMGHLTWQQTYGGAGADVGKSILFNPIDSGFVFAGYSSSFGNGGYDVYIVRTDKRGNKLWQTVAGGDDWDFGNDLCFGADGNPVVVGYSHNRTYGKIDAVILKFDISNGKLIKEKVFGGAELDEFVTIKMTSEGLLTVAGNTKSYSDVHGDFWLMKFNSHLDSLDTKFLGLPNRSEKCYDFTEDRNHNLVFTGSCDTSVSKIGKLQSYAIRTSVAGVKNNEILISGGKSDQDWAWSVAVSLYNYTYFFSRRYFFGSFGYEIQPVLIDYNFIPYIATSYGDVGVDEGYKIVSTSDTGFVVVGSTNGFGSIAEDVCIAKAKENSIALPANQIITNVPQTPFIEQSTLYLKEKKVYSRGSSYANFTYVICSLSGNLVTKGVSEQNYVDVSHLKSGIYFIQIVENPRINLKFSISD